MVGRPGAATLVGCRAADADPDAATLIANTGTVVAFDRTTEADGVAEQGDRTTVRLDSVEVDVQAPADLRQRIVATIRRAGLDSNGCPTTHALSTKPQWRPGTPAEVGSLQAVTTVSACRYGIGEPVPGLRPRLLGSLRLDGPAAARAIGEIAKAPVGGGPNRPDTCMKSYSYGEEAIVLRIRSAAGPTELVIRYSGCDHRGFDDGVAVRRLTAGALAPFIAGPHQQNVLIFDR